VLVAQYWLLAAVAWAGGWLSEAKLARRRGCPFRRADAESVGRTIARGDERGSSGISGFRRP